MPFLLTSPNLKGKAYTPHSGKGKDVMLMFLLKEPSNSSPPSEIPTSLRDYNGKKLNLPSPKTGSAHTKLVLSLVRGQEQRGKGALPSFALHLLSDQAGQSFTERNLPLYFWKRSVFRKKATWEQFPEKV